MTEQIPHIPITQIPAPTSIDLTDTDNVYPLLEDLTTADSAGPEAANRQPRALDVRTETIRGVLNQIVDIANALNTNLLHRDGVAVGSYMRGNLSMKDAVTNVKHRVVNCANGSAATDAVTKAQLDALQTFVSGLQTSLTQYVRRDGTLSMQANLDLASHQIVNLGTPLNAADAVTKAYADAQFTSILNGFVKRDGSLAMTGNLDMGGNKVVNLNLATPTQDGDGVSRGYLLAVISSIAATPPGTLTFFAGDVTIPGPPTGWLLCDGSAVSRTTYSALFALLGVTYGSGNGTTTFNVPDFRGRVAMGLDNMGGSSANRVTASAADTLGGTLGAETHTLILNEMPSHTHTYTDQYVAGTSGGSFVGPTTTNSTSTLDQQTGRTTGSAGAGAAHNNVQPSLAVNVLIKH
jgi:microcystin-dependent protein